MKRLRALLLVTVVFIVAAPAFAAPPIQQADYSAFEYAASGGSIFCSDTLGCPMCQSNMEATQSVCVKVRFANGFCVCSEPKAIPPGGRPTCGVLKGSCKFIW